MLGSENHAPYKKTTEKALLKKYRERLEACPKWEAYVIDLGVEKYILYEVKRKATKKTPPKYKTKFVVYTGDSRYPGEDRYIKAFNSKAEADTFAKKEMLKNPLVLLHVNKERTLVGGTETVTDFQIIRREYKSRPHPKSMDGKVLKELHRYYFEGCAAEWGSLESDSKTNQTWSVGHSLTLLFFSKEKPQGMIPQGLAAIPYLV